MTKMKIFVQSLLFGSLLSMVSSVESSRAQTPVFQRSPQEIAVCTAKYKSPLKIDFSVEIDRLCSNYPDENLDCAVGVMREYRVNFYRPALDACLLRFRNAALSRCVFDHMNETKKSGREVVIPSAIDECNANQQRAQVVQRQHTVHSVNYVIGKMNKAEFVEQIAKWLKVQPRLVSEIEVTDYFNVVNRMLETVAIKVGRQFRLYKVDFRVSAKSIRCTGTDFAPRNADDSPTRFFTLHECTVNGQPNELSRHFGALNYDFLNGLTREIQEKIQQVSAQWHGEGNVNFNRDHSDYLVIAY